MYHENIPRQVKICHYIYVDLSPVWEVSNA